MHLFCRLFGADLRHGEADMNENPISGPGHVFGEQSELNFATHTRDFHDTELVLAGD